SRTHLFEPWRLILPRPPRSIPGHETAFSRARMEEPVGPPPTPVLRTDMLMPWRLILPPLPRSMPEQEDMGPPAVAPSRASAEERVGPPSTPASRLRSLRMPWRLILPRPPRIMPGPLVPAWFSRPLAG